MGWIEKITELALAEIKMDSVFWEQIKQIILPCITGHISKPKGVFRRACPNCNNRIKPKSFFANNGTLIYYYGCINCKYEYVEMDIV